MSEEQCGITPFMKRMKVAADALRKKWNRKSTTCISVPTPTRQHHCNKCKKNSTRSHGETALCSWNPRISKQERKKRRKAEDILSYYLFLCCSKNWNRWCESDTIEGHTFWGLCVRTWSRVAVAITLEFEGYSDRTGFTSVMLASFRDGANGFIRESEGSTNCGSSEFEARIWCSSVWFHWSCFNGDATASECASKYRPLLPRAGFNQYAWKLDAPFLSPF